ncbi:MAG: response regulator [Ignavibacteriae bacterium]|nr:response regulator [Ignavibacteriota bacterium]
MRILVVDDEDSFRLAVRSALENSADYEISDCESGEEALALLKSQTFDVVLLDYRMPGISGLNVLQTMHEQKMETPVIMLTAAGTETVAVEAMKLGAYDYIRKEHVDIHHLPIAINGVYERFLFRKERQAREGKQQTAHVSEAMVNAISQIMTNALTIVSMYLQQFEEQMKPSVQPEAREQFTKSLQEIHQEFAVLASGLKSIVEISKDAESSQREITTLTDHRRTPVQTSPQTEMVRR